MPPSICTLAEIEALLMLAPDLLKPALAPGKSLMDLHAAAKRKGKAFKDAVDAALPNLPPAARLRIPMRDKRIKTAKSAYRRTAVGA
jgi:hypothetical protein